MRTAREILKLTRRSIRSFFGRYIALLLIVLLSVGFFAGLKVTKPAMYAVCDDYLKSQKLYDFRLLSRTGFLSMDITALSKLDGIRTAEGALSTDAMVTSADTSGPGPASNDAAGADQAAADQRSSTADQISPSYALQIRSLQEETNLPCLTAGRMPEAPYECLADRRLFGEDMLGKKLKVDTGAADSSSSLLQKTEFRIVGLCDSPMFLSTERGTTTIGSGQLDGFLLVPEDAFIDAIFTEVDLTLEEDKPIYSDEYDQLVSTVKKEIKGLLKDRAMSAYVLTRDENPGYLSYQNDTAIVSGIADIFPLFFVMIGMLVCITTMARMVEEERTQIGTLKALGFSSASISARYLLYAGSAAFLGWALGFLLGTYFLPQIFWIAFSSIYGFAPLPYLLSPSLALITLVFAMAGILISTYAATKSMLSGVPAQLIRPGVGKAGRRILLERIRPFWRSLSFLRKITLRNMFRYKQRLFMMLIEIGCCAGLVLTGFGVRDSLTDVTDLQYDEIQVYQMEASVENRKLEKAEAQVSSLLQKAESGGSGKRLSDTGNSSAASAATLPCSLSRVTLRSGKGSMDLVRLYSFGDGADLSGFWNLRSREDSPLKRNETKRIASPGEGEAVICTKIAQKLSLSVGDEFTVLNASLDKIHVKVSGIFENYIDNVLIIGASTYEKGFGTWKPDTLLIRATGENDAEGGHEDADVSEESLAESIGKIDGVITVALLSASRRTADHALSCVHYIILMLVLFSGALEFIVIYNLTSINLAERSREIATVEVLGFYPRETDSYVLRENLVLSVIASLLGIPLGYLFHQAVMSRIVVSSMVYDIHIEPLSYVTAVAVTIFFAFIVNLIMRRSIRKIPMAESLKAVE